MTEVRRLTAADAAVFHALRCRGLREDPTAFASSYEEETAQPIAEVAARMGTAAVFGAFEGGALVGVVGLKRESHRKLAHKVVLWGMYVAPEARRRGVGRRLVVSALAEAFGWPGVRQVYLGVNAANAAATALYVKLGFTAFGLERACMIVDGEPQDEIHMVCVAPPK